MVNDEGPPRYQDDRHADDKDQQHAGAELLQRCHGISPSTIALPFQRHAFEPRTAVPRPLPNDRTGNLPIPKAEDKMA
jgi:hypothetical protein